MADFTGTAADDTFVAAATVGTAAATTVNSGDTLDGGAGKDTLTITATADNNRSLTGLAVSNIETINLVGANNFGTSTTTTTAPAVAAGAKQVQVLDIANLSPVGERQTIDFVGRTKSGAGTYTFEVAGVSLTTASIAADATAATIATAVNTAITTAAGLAVGAAGSLNGIVASSSATSGVVTVNFTAAAGDVAVAVAGATGLSGAAAIDTPALSTFTAETQSLSFGTVTKSAAGTYAFTVAGVSLTTASIANSADAATIATAVNTAITTAAGLAVGAAGSLNGIVASNSVSTNTVTVKFTVGAGDVADSVIGSTGLSAAGTVTTSTAFAARNADLAVTVNGAQYSVASAIDPGVLSSNTTVRDAAQIVSKNNARTAINALLTDVIGNAISVGTSDEAGEIKLTSNTVGTAAPTITAAGRDSASNLISVDAADAATVANAGRTGAAAVAQQVQYTVGGTVAATDTFTLYVNGANLGNVVSGNTTAANAATNIVAALNAALGTGVASAIGGVITITAPVAGTALPLISIKANDAAGSDLTLVRSDIRDNATVGSTTTTTALGAASVAASTFVGAEVINLSGASNSTSVSAVAAGQTVGFTGLSSIVSTVGFASTVTNGLLSTTGSSGALTVTGAGLTSLSLAGTTAGGTTTVLSLTEGADATTVDAIKALNVNTSGSTVLNTDGLTALTSVTQSGAGGLTLNATGTSAKLATITTGAGADNVRVTTAVAADVASTTIDETVTAVVSTGAGNDRVVVKTGGTATNGITTVDLGDGSDTLIFDSINTGANTLSGGAGDDVFRIGAISNLASTTISGGTGTDVLLTSNATFSTADYTTLTANVSSVETLRLSSSATLDASKVAMGRIEFLGAGTNVVTEVAQDLALIRTAASLASFGTDAVANQVLPTNISASSKGYVFDNDANLAGNQTVFGGNINLTMTNVASTSTATVNAAALTLSVAALGQTVGATAPTATSLSDVAEVVSKVTLNQVAGVGGSDVQTINATLTSARGSGTRADLSSTGIGNEAMAELDLGTVTADTAGTAGQQGHLQNLTSVTVAGAGIVTINAGAIATADAKLATINLSGMTAFADLNDKGQEVASNGTTVGGYNNLSTSTVTLNTNTSETVLLGGAKDTVNTGSTIVKMDTITGFQVVADAVNPLVADATRSDVLNIAGASNGAGSFSSAIAVGSAGHAAKMTVTGSSLEAALLQASNLKGGANGTTDIENVVFHFGGNTYVYSDVTADGLSNDDALVQLSGTLNLDLLLTSNTIV